MALVGWKTEYEKRMPGEGLTNWEIFSIAEQACKDLEWEYLVADENTFTATTPTHWTLSEEIITIVVENNMVIFKSQGESLELYEGGRNKKNIEEHLIPAFKKVKASWQPEKLQSAATSLKTVATKQFKTGNRVEYDKMTYGFKDHEVTFLLNAINVLVFAAMVVKGVSIFEPLPGDILKWGGNVKVNVTGGQWWRLITSLFVHVGIFPLLVNLFGLYFIGLLVEPILGKLKFLIAYLCTGIFASLASIIWVSEGVTAGASGPVFGMYGLLLAFSTTRYINKKFPPIWLVCIAAYAIFNIVIGWHGGADNAANIGGFVSGIIIGYLFYYFHFRKKLARAGGTRISIEVMLITGLLLFYYLKKNGRDDSFEFEKAVMRLNQIEVNAMTQMQQLQSAKTNNEAAQFLKDKALPEWKHFQKEIMKTDAYTLDDEFKQKRKLLSNYAQLRIRQTELIYKSMQEQTDKYNPEIDEVSDKIERIIDQLGN